MTKTLTLETIGCMIRNSGSFSHLDYHFGGLMADMANENHKPAAMLAGAIVSACQRSGHICMDLRNLNKNEILKDFVNLSLPDDRELAEQLCASGIGGSPGEQKPLIVDKDQRLYLYRYWEYEHRLGRALIQRSLNDPGDVDLDRLKEGLRRLFPPDMADPEIDRQKWAAFAAIRKRLCIISGGPGTGKTTTVFKIMALLQECVNGPPLRIVLAAPTGKAASRLSEAISESKKNFANMCSKEILDAIPDEAATIHRVLKPVTGTPNFRRNAENPVTADVMIVDESSMVDMALMSKLVQALKPETRLILLGDKDQLSSVEAGAVFGDICDTGNTHGVSARFAEEFAKITGEDMSVHVGSKSRPGMTDCVVTLEKNYRFSRESGIGQLSRFVQQQNCEEALAILKAPEVEDVVWRTPPKQISKFLTSLLKDGYEAYFAARSIEDRFAALDRFRVLCAVKEGAFGVNRLNETAERLMLKNTPFPANKRWYDGRPVMITRNDYRLNLFNGDIGVMADNGEPDGAIRTFFSDSGGDFRKLHPLRLPEHQTVFALTVHKSQGSEFDHVLIVLPNTENQVLTRELIYTGVSRARKRVEIITSEKIFEMAVSKINTRYSGLKDMLWKEEESS